MRSRRLFVLLGSLVVGAVAAVAAGRSPIPQRADRATSTAAVPAPELPTILVSRQLMAAQGLAVGSIVSISADASGRSPRRFRIVGSYEPVADPMRLGDLRHEVRLHLPDLLALTADGTNAADLDAVDAVNAAVDPAADLAALGGAIRSRAPGVAVSSTSGARAETFVVLERFHLAIAIVTVTAGSVFLLALMLMLADERRAIVGILRLIGFNRRRLMIHVLVEGAVIAVTGAAFGVLLSAAMEAGINHFFQWRYDTALVFVRITPAVALRAMAISVPLGILAILASSWAILRHQSLTAGRR
jgi:putative ABC transport system permease protein